MIFEDSSNNPYENIIPGYIDLLVFTLIFLAVWFLSGALLAFWVNKDAKKRGESGLYYSLAVVLTNIVGLLVYLVVRDNEACELEEDKLACEMKELERDSLA